MHFLISFSSSLYRPCRFVPGSRRSTTSKLQHCCSCEAWKMTSGGSGLDSLSCKVSKLTLARSKNTATDKSSRAFVPLFENRLALSEAYCAILRRFLSVIYHIRLLHESQLPHAHRLSL